MQENATVTATPMTVCNVTGVTHGDGATKKNGNRKISCFFLSIHHINLKFDMSMVCSQP